MNEKISIPDLADLLVQKTSCSKKDAEAFLRECFGLAAEIVSEGEPLKIAGLGIFEPVWVESRSSINVQTGQPFEIPGHYKLSFIPEKSMRDAVNAPFACFETEILDDDVDLGPEISQPETDEDEDAEGNESISEASPVTVEAQVIQETPISPATDTLYVVATKGEEPRPDQSAVTDIPAAIDSRKPALSPKTNGIAGHFAVVLTLVSGFLILILIAAYMLFRPHKQADPKQQAGYAQAQSPEPRQNTTIHATDTLPEKAEKIEPETIKAPVIEVIEPGVFMTRLARKHFGHKAFWVYIYEENKQIIQNPDKIPIGTLLVIPDKSKYGIDMNDSTSIEKAREKAKIILAAFE